MSKSLLLQESDLQPYDGFFPSALGNIHFEEEAQRTNGPVMHLAYRRGDEFVREDLQILPSDHGRSFENLEYVLSTISDGLAIYGAEELLFSGPRQISDFLQHEFAQYGSGRWLSLDLNAKSFGRFEFTEVEKESDLPQAFERTIIPAVELGEDAAGWDIGATDIKGIRFRDGEVIYCGIDEWNPKEHMDVTYHHGIMNKVISGILNADTNKLKFMGGSSSGILMDNELRYGNIARTLGPNGPIVFTQSVLRKIEKEKGLDFLIANDGDRSALAGYLFIEGTKRAVIAEAFGSHRAFGYVGPNGELYSRFNETAFQRISRGEPTCQWSHLPGVGGEFLSQLGVSYFFGLSDIKKNEVIDVLKTVKHRDYQYKEGHENLPQYQLIAMREMAEHEDTRAVDIFRKIGLVWGHGLRRALDYCKDTSHVIAMGRVMTGYAGKVITENAQDVLNRVYGVNNLKFVNPDSDKHLLNRRIVEGIENRGYEFSQLMQAAAAAYLRKAG